MKDRIVHLSLGGTISGNVPEYQEIELLSKFFSDFVDIDKYINCSLNLKNPLESISICSKDSREITEDDRKKLLDTILDYYSRGFRKFLITHGTYTMPDTGKYLVENISQEVIGDLSVVITGSMYPWNLIGSDAPMNIGAALSSLVNMSSIGVKISMHAKNFDPLKVRKDAENLIFEE